MTEENILEVLPSIRLARLFYIYGKWDAFLKIGFMKASYDYYDVFWEMIEAATDFTALDFSADMCITKWYFSFEAMVEYYRLCRVYSELNGLKLRDNPFMQSAQYYVEFAMDLNEHIGYAWHLNTRINHKRASGIVLYTDENFCAEYELLEALLSIGSWFQHHLKRLRGIVEEEKGKRQMALTHPEVMAA